METAVPFIAMVVQQLAQIGSMVAAKVAMSSGMTPFTFTFYSSAFSTLILIPLSFLLHRYLFSTSFHTSWVKLKQIQAKLYIMIQFNSSKLYLDLNGLISDGSNNGS